jgi:Zn-dependent peptidase ImmA (M78 family)
LSLKLQRSREAEILELSSDVADEDSSAGRVSPTRICRAKDIKVAHKNYGAGKFDGMLVLSEGQWVILCNLDTGNSPGSTRERFTIAHELGHYHIPEHRKQLLAGCRSHGSYAGAFDGADSPEELEADTFAANLLMPVGRFVPKLNKLKQTPLVTIRALRQEFDTSWESTAIQAMRHDARIITIAKWKTEGFAWHRISEPAFKADGFRKFQLRDIAALPRDSATAAALGEADTGNDHPIHEGVVTAAHCFGWVAAGGKRDILIREEAVRNGRFGVLSVFSAYESPQNGRKP